MFRGGICNRSWKGLRCPILLALCVLWQGGLAFAQETGTAPEEISNPFVALSSTQALSTPSWAASPLFTAGSVSQGSQNPGSGSFPASSSSVSGSLGFAGSAALPGYSNPGSRALPGYDAPGTKDGDLLITSSISTGVIFDSNIFELPSKPVKDYIFFTSPTIDVVRNGVSSQQELHFSSTIAAYDTNTADNYQDFFVSLRQTYLFSADSQVYAYLSYADGYQRRISQNFDIPTNAATPVHEEAYLAAVGYSKIWGSVQAGVNLTGSTENYDHIYTLSGTYIPQSSRNENDVILNAYLNWNINSVLSSYLSVQAFSSSFEQASLNYNQVEISQAVTAAITSKLNLSFLIGVREQDPYNNPLIHLGSLMKYDTQLTWNPTQRMSFRLTGGYSDLGLDAIAGIYAGGFAQHCSFDASYLIWRNLALQAGVGYEKRYLAGSGDVEGLLQIRSALTYEFSSHVGMSLLMGRQESTSNSALYNFDESIVQSSLNIRF